MTDAERISALQSHGYNDREAAFLCLAALHSGYFLRRQYHAFAGVENGKASLLLEEKLIENFVQPERRAASPVVSFCYVDEGVLSLSGFESFLGRYRDLFRCLARVRLVYVAASLWLFRTAREKFTKFVSRLQSPGQARVGRELAEYFRLRGLVEADHYHELDTDDLDRLRQYMKRFAAPRFEARYQSWKTAPDQPECRQTGPVEVALETCLLPHDYDIFATAEPETSGQPHGVNGSCTSVRGETPFATGFHRKRS